MRIKPIIYILSIFTLLSLTILFFIHIDNTRLEKIVNTHDFIEIDQVKIYSSTNSEITLLKLIQEELTILNQDLYKFFDYMPKEKPHLILFEDIDELRKKHASLDDIGAFYDPKSNVIALPIYESVSMPFNEKVFIKYLRHEYTHYYLTSYLRENDIASIPKWFDEGLAEYVSISMKGQYAAIPTEALIDFTLLNSRRDWAEYRKKSSQLYVQSHFAINYIIQKKDHFVIKQIIDESEHLGFEDAFSKYTGVQLSELHEKLDLNENN